MKNQRQINKELRYYNRKNYYLLFLCLFLSELLITAYAVMMQSPTVLTILPEGGDSRKQVSMIFFLAGFGCGVFVVYAAALFLKYKSRETGILMALGASARQLGARLLRELLLVSGISFLGGMVLGTPLAFCIWKLFCIFLVNTEETSFSIGVQAYGISVCYALVCMVLLIFMGILFIRQTDVIAIVHNERKCEPVRDVKPWYGWAGSLLMILGGVCGYMTPMLCVRMLNWYCPAWINVTYLPLFVGLYMLLLYIVVHGRKKGKKRWRDIITGSMMKFQGRQTVNSMLVITVLLAGAYFAAFYTPMMLSGSQKAIDERPIDFLFPYRQDQDMLTEEEIKALAESYQVEITEYSTYPLAVLAHDGSTQIMDSRRNFHYEYRELVGEGNYLPASEFNRIAKQDIEVPEGTCRAVIGEDGGNAFWLANDTTMLTNPVTGKTLGISFDGYVCDNMLSGKYYVLNDEDYMKISEGLTDEWRERLVAFNVADVDGSYGFAQELYRQIVARTGSDCQVTRMDDRIYDRQARTGSFGEYEDSGSDITISFKEYQSFYFKQFWKYAPMFRILDKTDFLSTYAVFLMLFLFISLICFAAVFIIIYTRCMTIAMNSRLVYKDLKHLGAGHDFLINSVRGQVGKVFKAPAAVGTVAIYLFYCLILYMNDGGRFTPGELAGLGSCAAVVGVVTLCIWGFYRFVLKRVCEKLEIR